MSKVKIFVRELYWLFQDNAEEVLSQYTFKLFCHWYLSRILLSRIGLKSDFLKDKTYKLNYKAFGTTSRNIFYEYWRKW
ncbi:MAG: hypothetical protein Q6351_011005 [Candidatus Njordarchaeum guaymaensis]